VTPITPLLRCQLCGAEDLVPFLDIGTHPFSTGLLKAPHDPVARFPLAMLECRQCRLLQLREPAPAEKIRPFFDWVTFREPEQHLDEVAARLLKLEGLAGTSDVRVLGLTSKDDTLLDRLRRGGWAGCNRLDLKRDLGVTAPLANVESVPQSLTPARATAIVKARGAFDLVITRHMYEHAQDLARFTRGLAAMVKPGGYLMLEVPDCSRSLDLCDYTMIWEEHSVYFTPATFFAALDRHSFSAAITAIYPYPYENCLVLVARKTEQASVAARDCGSATNYAESFKRVTAALQASLSAAAARSPVGLYGAGHLTAAFVNYHGLAKYISHLVDDTPQKQGLYMPGFDMPIEKPALMVESGVKLCLLGLAPEVEPKVITRNEAYVRTGGTFASLLASSGSSWRKQIAA
jgi:hypothetical protein